MLDINPIILLLTIENDKFDCKTFQLFLRVIFLNGKFLYTFNVLFQSHFIGQHKGKMEQGISYTPSV